MEYLYRYMSFPQPSSGNCSQTQAFGRLKHLIVDNLCYLSSPSWFNDPYDCRAFFSLDGCDDSDAEKFVQEIVKILRIGLADPAHSGASGVEEWIERLDRRWDEDTRAAFGINSPAFRELVDTVRPEIDEQTARTAILCLTVEPRDLLMWSHYANGHRGFCLQFDGEVLGSLPEVGLVEVEYISQYPSLKELVSDKWRPNWPRFFLSRKSARWDYEREWRLLARADDGIEQVTSDPIQLPPEALTGIILGAEMPCQHGEQIKKWLKDRADDLCVYKAALRKDEYGLDFDTEP